MDAPLTTPPRQRAPTWRKLALALGVFAASLLLCEIGLRVWLRIDGRPYSAWRTLVQIRRAADATRAFVPTRPDDPAGPEDRPGPILHPYAGGEAWHDTGGVLEHFRERARDGDYTILVVGGSVAASFAGTLHAKLPGLLEAEPALAGRHVVVLNFAHAAYKQPQQVTRLVYLLSLGYRPDAVIDIDGFNEVALALENAKAGIHPVYPTPPVWGVVATDFGVDTLRDVEIVSRMMATRSRARSIAAEAERWHLIESSWLGRWTLARLATLNDQFFRQQREFLSRASAPGPALRRQLNGPDFDANDEAVMAACVRCWVESSMSLQDLCASRDIRFVHILQPTLNDVGSKPVSEAEAALPPPSRNWITGARVGYPLLRARIPELRAHGVRFLDQSRVFADVREPVYFDACHIDGGGEQIWYERLAPALRDALLQP